MRSVDSEPGIPIAVQAARAIDYGEGDPTDRVNPRERQRADSDAEQYEPPGREPELAAHHRVVSAPLEAPGRDDQERERICARNRDPLSEAITQPRRAVCCCGVAGEVRGLQPEAAKRCATFYAQGPDGLTLSVRWAGLRRYVHASTDLRRGVRLRCIFVADERLTRRATLASTSTRRTSRRRRETSPRRTFIRAGRPAPVATAFPRGLFGSSKTLGKTVPPRLLSLRQPRLMDRRTVGRALRSSTGRGAREETSPEGALVLWAGWRRSLAGTRQETGWASFCR